MFEDSADLLCALLHAGVRHFQAQMILWTEPKFLREVLGSTKSVDNHETQWLHNFTPFLFRECCGIQSTLRGFHMMDRRPIHATGCGHQDTFITSPQCLIGSAEADFCFFMSPLVACQNPRTSMLSSGGILLVVVSQPINPDTCVLAGTLSLVVHFHWPLVHLKSMKLQEHLSGWSAPPAQRGPPCLHVGIAC